MLGVEAARFFESGAAPYPQRACVERRDRDAQGRGIIGLDRVSGHGFHQRSSQALSGQVGPQPHPDIARQQVEGGLVFGFAAATGCAAHYRAGMPERAVMGRLGLPLLADMGDVTVELIPSSADPAGSGQIGVPVVAPALAGALFSLTGRRHRVLPLVPPA